MDNLFEHSMLEDHSGSEYSFISTNTDDPKTLDEALTGAEAEEWKRAMETEMETEMETLKNMGAWKLEPLPVGREPIGMQMGICQKKR